MHYVISIHDTSLVVNHSMGPIILVVNLVNDNIVTNKIDELNESNNVRNLEDNNEIEANELLRIEHRPAPQLTKLNGSWSEILKVREMNVPQFN